MKIIIDYDSSWQNSVLTGSNDEPVKKRDFKASSKSKEVEDVRNITYNTVLGILSRLIGDQRKLNQAKQSEDFYFKDMSISFKHTKLQNQWLEKVFLINKSENRPTQSSFIGVLNENEPLFFSEYAATLWAILDLDLHELINFILNPTVQKSEDRVSPKRILNRIQFIQSMDSIQFSKDKIAVIKNKINKELDKEKPNQNRIKDLKQDINHIMNEVNNSETGEFEIKLQKCLDILKTKFTEEEFIEKNGSIFPIRLYSASLYLMIEEMKNQNIDISNLVSNKGAIKGFSKRNFNGVRDFLNPLMGNKKKTTHTPYNLTKADGQLEITLDITTDKAKELKQMIDNAGVSSFYLGKKGLAYVTDIRLR